MRVTVSTLCCEIVCEMKIFRKISKKIFSDCHLLLPQGPRGEESVDVFEDVENIEDSIVIQPICQRADHFEWREG